MATALFTFAFTGIVGTVLFERRGSIDWRITVAVCAAALPCAFAGAWLNSLAPSEILLLLLAVVIVFAGVYTLAAWHGTRGPALQSRPAAQQALLAGIGAVAGFGSGLTGVGGPVLSVPLMVLAGFPALASIGTSQVIQIVAAVSGTVANVSFGAIHFGLSVPVTLVEIAGVFLGTHLAHAVSQSLLRRVVGILCVGVGLMLIVQAMRGPTS